MAYGIRRELDDPAKALAFAAHFEDRYLTPAFGARSKAKVDLLMFTALVKAGALDPGAPVYKLARSFKITPRKMRTLLFNWQLRDPGFRSDLTGALRVALQRTRFSKDGTLLSFGIESPLLKEEVMARLKARGVFADASISRDIVRMPVDEFVAKLVQDKQLKDKSFKAIAAGVLGKIGDEVTTDLVGGAVPVAKEFGGFLLGLLRSKGANAPDAAVDVLSFAGAEA